ncbi:pilus assembly protein TadG-related protein [Novosphingobium sp. BL-8A]|uniref:pilus assembly protein TadG-related protein n=1 Tax=Novosphingobium sp. BL-8A TaxID=3127639 RepID=UPI00375691B6
MRHQKSPIQRLPERLLRDTAGNILPLAAIGMVVAAAVVGSGIDLSRNYKVRNQLQAACDAAVLAGRRTVTTAGFDTASQTAANNYFATNFDSSSQETTGTSFLASSDDEGKTVTGTASTTLNTLVMRLFGFNSFNVSVSCASSMGVGNADVMMVLDTTGSMGSNKVSNGQTRLAALQDAMKSFYTTLKGATANTNARVRFGFVPYSTSVNVGRLLYDLNPNYLVDSFAYQTKQARFLDFTSATLGTSSTNNATPGTLGDDVMYNTTKYNSLSKCQKALPSAGTSTSTGTTTSAYTSVSGSDPNMTVVRTITTSPAQTVYACQGSGSSYYIYSHTQTQGAVTTQNWTKVKFAIGAPTTNSTFYDWIWQKATLSTNVYKSFSATPIYTGNKGAAVSTTWGGCIRERKTYNTFSYSVAGGMSPSNAYDVDLDTTPTNDDTRWAPLWPEVGYERYSSSGADTTTSPTSYGATSPSSAPCPAKAQLLTEMSQADFNTYTNSLVATGNTYLDIGMIWGGRMISPSGIFSTNVNTAPTNGGEVARHIIFMTDGVMEPSNSVNQAWGIEWWDRNVTTDGTTDDAKRHTARFLGVCQAIKAKGVRVWVIAFTSDLSDDLKTCASTNSSYVASDATQLNTAFQEIAKQVGELRLTQ